MTNDTKITIITPALNSAATIRDTIDSVLGQTHANFEYIIVDGASRDQTVPIVKTYNGRISHLLSEPDDGLYDAMNKGIARAKGEIVAILNSDDYYVHPRVFEKVVRIFNTQSVDSVYGDLNYVSARNPDRIVRRWRSGAFHPDNFLYGWMPPHPAFFVRREVYERHGAFDTRFRNAADYELMLRLLYKHRISTFYLPEVLVHMRTGGISNRNLRSRLRANREDRMAWRYNDLHPPFYTTLLKPVRKMSQFIPSITSLFS